MKKIIIVLLLLSAVSRSDANDNVLMNYQYTYYNNGNVKSVDGAPIPSMSGRQLENQYTETGNRIYKITDTRTGEVLATYSYDGRGNITSDGKYVYIYNQHNRLARVKVGNVIIGEYFYDGFGRRIKKIAYGDVTHYHYFQFTGQLLAESHGDGTPSRDYIYLNGELVAMMVYGDQHGFYYFLNDHLGTPCKIVDSNGIVVWEAAYMPFGEAQILVEVLENNIRFKGHYYDKETGNHYNINRYYVPKTGRYLTPDPIGLAGGINLYPYVLNNPINLIDPYGLFPPGFLDDPRVPKNFKKLPIDIQIAMIEAYRKEQESKFGPQITNIFKPISISNKNTSAYDKCVSECLSQVLLGEVGTQLLTETGIEVSTKLAWKFGQKNIPIAGWFSTSYSGYSAMRCFIDCKEHECKDE